MTNARGPLTGIELKSSVLAQAWKASAEVVRFDERVSGRPTPMPAVLLWREITATNRHADAETIALVRLAAWGAQLPRDVAADAALVEQARAIDRFREADDLGRLHDDWTTRIGARHDSSAWRLADLLIEQPIVNAAVISARLDVTQTAARTSVAALVEAGVLEPLSAARRNQAWRAPAVLAAAEAVLGGDPPRAGINPR